MADRFPSIEDFDEGQTTANPDSNDLLDSGDAGTGDFLSRERAALGDDADQFSSPQDGGVPRVSVQGEDDDLMGGTNGDVAQFQSQFPAVDSGNEAVGPGGTITGRKSPFLGSGAASQGRAHSPASFSANVAAEEEPELIKEWRERRDMGIASREEKSESRKQETIKAAQESIDEFYENYNNKKEKGIAQTRKDAEEFLKKREDTTAGGTSWERISKLVDVKGAASKGLGGGEGKDRFKGLLVSLMKDENAPGAKGY